MKYYVYVHLTEDTGEIFYVGKGSGSRMKAKCKRNPYWKNVASKHGFVWFIICYFEEESQAYDLEKMLISKLGFRNYGGLLINMTTGGDGTNNSHMRSEEQKRITREKHSSNMKKRWEGNRESMTDQVKSISKDPNVLRKRSINSKKMWSDPEYRSNMSEKRRNTWGNSEHREKRINTMNSPDYRKNQSEKKTGRNSPKWKGDIMMISPMGIVIGVFESAASCKKAEGIDNTLVCKKLKNGEPVKQGKFKGYRFEYAT